MADWASLNGTRVVSATVTMPYYGVWEAEVELSAAVAVTGVATLVMGNLTLVGSAYRQDSYGGQQTVRMQGGAGGWAKQITPKAYSLPGGVLLSMVLGDVAKEVGETVNVATDGPVGSAYVREGGCAAQRVLEQLAGVQWWVDKAGVTQIGPRPTTPVPSALQLLSYEPESGKVAVATESPADWLPGASFTAPQLSQTLVASLVTHKVTGGGGATVEMLAMPTAGALSGVDRIIASLKAIIRGELPRLTFLGVYEYAVQRVAANGSTLDASPTNTTLGLPGLQGVTLRNGVAGTVCRPAAGSLVAIGFLNGDPTRPFVHGGFDGSNAQSITLQGGSVAAARGGYTSVPPGLPLPTGAAPETVPFPPASVVVPTGDRVIVAFTALDSAGNPASQTTQPTLTPAPSLWNSPDTSKENVGYPATAAGFLQALAGSASCLPTGVGVGVVYAFAATGSQTVTIG